MSLIIPLSAYGKKRESTKKIKLSTQDKSKKCSISKCPFRSVISIQIGIEKRQLCQKHYDQSIRKYEKHPPIFKKASELLD